MSPLFLLVLVMLVLALLAAFLLRPFVAARRIGWPAIAIVACAPVAVVGIYLLVGEPAALLASPASARVTTASQPASMDRGQARAGQRQAGSISSLVEGLAARLEAGGGDGGDWLLLAQSYEHLGQPRRAWTAYEQAVARGVRDEALAQRLMFAREAPAGAATQAAFRISGTVEADPAALAAIPRGATVFVVARAADGPPMPLAVARYAADRFPVAFELDARHLMLPAADASRYGRYTVYAKVSPTGDATASLAGIVSDQVEIGADARPVTVALHGGNDG